MDKAELLRGLQSEASELPSSHVVGSLSCEWEVHKWERESIQHLTFLGVQCEDLNLHDQIIWLTQGQTTELRLEFRLAVVKLYTYRLFYL